jgi:hypothetical protein
MENNNNIKGSGISLLGKRLGKDVSLDCDFYYIRKILAACRSVDCYPLDNQLINSKTSLSK